MPPTKGKLSNRCAECRHERWCVPLSGIAQTELSVVVLAPAEHSASTRLCTCGVGRTKLKIGYANITECGDFSCLESIGGITEAELAVIVLTPALGDIAWRD